MNEPSVTTDPEDNVPGICRMLRLPRALLASVVLACGAIAVPTAAQEPPKFLSKQEVDKALTGKVLLFNRPSDGKAVRWDIRSGGHVFANLVGRTYGGDSGGGFPGNWEAREDGAMCMKWRDNSPGQCYFYYWDGDKLKRTSEPTVEAAASAITIDFEK